MQRPEQSGFIPGHLKSDRIFTLNMPLQTRREHHQPLWTMYKDLRVGFVSVDRSSTTIADLEKEWYKGAQRAVQSYVPISDWFSMNSDVSQGCRIAPYLFLLPTDRIIERIVHHGYPRAMLVYCTLTDLDSALLSVMHGVLTLFQEI
jgi:hypothetical protein